MRDNHQLKFLHITYGNWWPNKRQIFFVSSPEIKVAWIWSENSIKNQSNLCWNNIVCRVIYLHSSEQWRIKKICKVHICCSFDFCIHSTNNTISFLVALLVNNYIPERWRKEWDNKVETQIQCTLSILFKQNTIEIKKKIKFPSNITTVIIMLPHINFWSFFCNCYSSQLTNCMEFYPDNFQI